MGKKGAKIEENDAKWCENSAKTCYFSAVVIE